MKILILCTGNSCRSQMAQGILQSLEPELIVCSAGTKPEKEVSPKAVTVMQELGIDISHHKPKHIDKYINQEWDYVITVCDNAREICPVFPGKVKHRLHIGFDDPWAAKGSGEEILNEYRRIRDEIKREFELFYKNKIKFNNL